MLPPKASLFLLGAQAAGFGTILVMKPTVLLDAFLFRDPEKWETDASMHLFCVLGFAFLAFAAIALTASDWSPASQIRMIRCSLLVSLVGLADCVFTHSISKRRLSLGAITQSALPIIAVHATNAVLALSTPGVLAKLTLDMMRSKHKIVPASVMEARCARALSIGLIVIGIILIPKPTHGVVFASFPEFAVAEPRVVAIWCGFALSTLGLVGVFCCTHRRHAPFLNACILVAIAVCLLRILIIFCGAFARHYKLIMIHNMF